MRYADIQTTEIDPSEYSDKTHAFILPVRVTGTMPVKSTFQPARAWVELEGDHVLADYSSNTIYESLGPDEWLAMVEAYGSVLIYCRTLDYAKDELSKFRPLLWIDDNWGYLEDAEISICGTVYTVDFKEKRIMRLIQNFVTYQKSNIDAEQYL